MEKIIQYLKNKNKTIATMESCTGGYLSSEITNVEGASDVFKIGLVTYCNEFKEYFGVSKETIKKYSVYSSQVSKEMAQNVCKIAKSDFGIGITGMLGTRDLKNESDEINIVYISIYIKDNKETLTYKIQPEGQNRLEKKQNIVKYIKNKLYEICK